MERTLASRAWHDPRREGVMEKLLTTEFWLSQTAVIMSAPWVIIPLLLMSGFIGWKIKGGIDGGARLLRAENKALEAQLQLARREASGTDQKLISIRTEIAELKRQVEARANPDALKRLAATVESQANEAATANSTLRQLLRDASGRIRRTS